MLKSLAGTDSENRNMLTKCGEIYYQKSQWFFLCAFCGMDVRSHEEFRCHFESKHFKEFIDMGSIDPFLEEETLSLALSLNSVASKANDPLKCEMRCSVKKDNILTINVENEQPEILDNVPEHSELEYDVQTKEFENCWAENPIKNSQVIETQAYDEMSVHEGSLYDSESSNIVWNTLDFIKKCTKKRPYKPRNKLFSCSYCGRTFRRRYQFESHLNIHTGAKPHQCEICGRQFRAVTTLQRHLSTHKQRNFVCNYCNKSFTHKVALLSHETRHTQERSAPCDLCEKRFYTVNQLDTHKRRVHKESNDLLPFACDLCSNRYRTSSMLSTHKFRKHYKTAKFECEKCEKKFIDVQRLEDHQKIHVDAKISCQYINVSKKS